MKPGVHLALLCALTHAVYAAPPAFTSVNEQWAFSSVPDVWIGERQDIHTWTNREGLLQLADLRVRKDGEPFYVHHALTSVCGSIGGKESPCMLHHFTGYYDELGRFLGYKVDKAFPFTRAEHALFAIFDYEFLDRILRDPAHPLGDLDASAAVDAVTGATAAYAADKAVPGAFYTCLTLWRLAQRSVPARLEAWTLKRADEAYVRGWMRRERRLKIWWFLDHADDSPLPPGKKAELAYEALASMDTDIQIAAIRYLERAGAPFRAERALGAAYADLHSDARAAFLSWWQKNHYAPPELLATLRDELHRNASKASPVTIQTLAFLAGTSIEGSSEWHPVLEELADKNPSTYTRAKAAELLKKIGQ